MASQMQTALALIRAGRSYQEASESSGLPWTAIRDEWERLKEDKK
jgi:hypothetical protein